MKLNIKIIATGISALLGMQMQAMQEQQPEVARPSVLTSPSERQKFYTELIQQAINDNNIEEVRSLLTRALKFGFDINALDRDSGQSLLEQAVSAGKAPIVELLLKAGASPNGANRQGETPLHIAVRANNLDIMKMLIGAGADVNARTNEGESPLMQAIVYLQPSLAKALLEVPGIILPEKKEGIALLDWLLQNKLSWSLTNKLARSVQARADYDDLVKFFASHYTTLTGLSADTIVKNIERYRNQLHLLPQELQEEVNRRLKS